MTLSPELRRRRATEANRKWLAKQSRSYRFLSGANKQAAKFGAGRLSPSVALSEGPCHYCGSEATTWDHVIPMSKGGPNAVENLVPCCEPCNRRKGRSGPERATVPTYMTLLCGWCWKPIRRQTRNITGRYVSCVEHRPKLSHNPLPFGSPAFCRDVLRISRTGRYPEERLLIAGGLPE